MNEVELLKNLNHKNIVKYLGSCRTKTHLVGVPYVPASFPKWYCCAWH